MEFSTGASELMLDREELGVELVLSVSRLPDELDALVHDANFFDGLDKVVLSLDSSGLMRRLVVLRNPVSAASKSNSANEFTLIARLDGMVPELTHNMQLTRILRCEACTLLFRSAVLLYL